MNTRIVAGVGIGLMAAFGTFAQGPADSPLASWPAPPRGGASSPEYSLRG